MKLAPHAKLYPSLILSLIISACGGQNSASDPKSEMAQAETDGVTEATPVDSNSGQTPDPATETVQPEITDSAVETSPVNSGGAQTPNPTNETSPATAIDANLETQETNNESAEQEPTATVVVHNYANQEKPFYIQRDNTTVNTITDAGATLGRVLFYDKSLSKDNTVSCASCHKQSLAFSDSSVVSTGVNGQTGRHSMRLVNTRFAEEVRFFWDERAESLEAQSTQPIRDHAEMGFSGTNGDPEFAELLQKLSAIPYYNTLFVDAFGSTVITEHGMQSALAQFIRSIQSFDSRYDQGRATANNDRAPFANFSAVENEGKRLFIERPEFNGNGQRIAGTGLGCQVCHRAPEFDIDPNTRNNGVISVASNLLEVDTENTRSPTLRDLFLPNGLDNGPFMHDGSLATFTDVMDHYNNITADANQNRTLDNRLSGGIRQGNEPPTRGPGQRLLLTDSERSALTAFMKTLSGSKLYTDERWSDPFDENNSLTER